METALKTLHGLSFQELKKKHPEIPEEWLPRPRFSDKTANKLTSCIISFLRCSGNQAERISVTGRPVDNRKTYTDVLGHKRQIGCLQWIPTRMQRGSADISATIKGRSVKIEVKVGRDYQRQAQIAYQRDVEAAGGVYFIATNFQEFYEWYMKIF